MGLTQALATSLSGLQATQTGLSIVAGNVANSQTVGYTARSVTLAETPAGDGGSGVAVTSVNRLLDTFVQQQLWTESAGRSYANTIANFYNQLQQVYGQPGSSTTLDSTFNNLTSAVQALSTSPTSYAAQNQTISSAQAFAQQRTARRQPSSRCAARPTRASPTMCSRPTTRCSRSPVSIINCRAAWTTAPRPRSRISAINI